MGLWVWGGEGLKGQRVGSRSSVGLWAGEGLWDGGVNLRGYGDLRAGA